MDSTLQKIVSSTVADIIDVSTKNGNMLESGPAVSLLQVGDCPLSCFFFQNQF